MNKDGIVPALDNEWRIELQFDASQTIDHFTSNRGVRQEPIRLSHSFVDGTIKSYKVDSLIPLLIQNNNNLLVLGDTGIDK